MDTKEPLLSLSRSSGELSSAGDSLAQAFARFIQSSSRLEEVYRQLQEQIHFLSHELAERNEALNQSLICNERMRSKLQQVLQLMPCGVMVVQANNEISTINSECCRLLGIRLQDLQEGSFGPLTGLAELASVRGADLLSSITAADADREICLRGSEGELWVSVRSRHLYSAGNDGCGDERIFVLRDVTGRRRAEEERDRGRKAMAIAEVAVMLAHEIRNPLASMELFSELIEHDEERRAEWISELRAGVRLLSNTVSNVLSFDLPRPLPLGPVEISRTVSCAVALMQPLARQAGVFLEYQSADPGLLVMGNEGALQQVWVNLLINAIRHTPPGGRVSVSLAEQICDQRDARQKWAIVECLDSGSGIPEADLERLFEAGFSGSGRSPGLGLAVCDRIVRLQGGQVSAENADSGGARFSVKLPQFLRGCAE